MSFTIEMTLTATDESSGRVFHGSRHDITAAHRAGRSGAVEAAVSRGLAEAESSTRAVEALGVKMGWPVAELWLYDEARQLLALAARHTGPGHTGPTRLGGFALDELGPGAGLPGRAR